MKPHVLFYGLSLATTAVLAQTNELRLIATPSQISTCQSEPVEIEWQGGHANFHLSVLPGSSISNIPIVAFPGQDGYRFSWSNVTIAAGTTILFRIYDSGGRGATDYSSPIIVQAGPDQTCVTDVGGRPGFTSPTSVHTCKPATIEWVGGTAPYSLSVHLSGSGLLMGKFPAHNHHSFTWPRVDIPTGNAITLVLVDSLGRSQTSTQLLVQAGQDESCVKNRTGGIEFLHWTDPPKQLFTCEPARLDWEGGAGSHYVSVSSNGQPPGLVSRQSVNNFTCPHVNAPEGSVVTFRVLDVSRNVQIVSSVTVQAGHDQTCVKTGANGCGNLQFIVPERPPPVVTCQTYRIDWSGGVPPYEVSIIAGMFWPSPKVLRQFPAQTNDTLIWSEVDIVAGTPIAFLVRDSEGTTERSQPSYVQGGLDQTCSAFRFEHIPKLVTCEPAEIQWSGGEGPFRLRVRYSDERGEHSFKQFVIKCGRSVLWSHVDFPAGSEVTLELNDARGGRLTSAPVVVQAGKDQSCSKSGLGYLVFDYHAQYELVTCQPARIPWYANKAPYFLSVLPGDQPCAEPLLQFQPQFGDAFIWSHVNISAGTKVMFRIMDSEGLVDYSLSRRVRAGPDQGCVHELGEDNTFLQHQGP